MVVDFCSYDMPGRVGGPDVWLRRLLPDLKRLGITPRLKFFTWGDPALCQTIHALRAEGFECHVTPWLGYTERNIAWLLEQVRENPPDVFVANLMVPAFYAGHELRQAGIPTVGVIHADEPLCGGLIERFVFGRASDRVSGLVCVSQFLLDKVLAQKTQGVEFRRIPCGVNIPRQTHAPLGRGLRLAYVGRLVEEQKRISEVTRAFCQVIREIPDTEAVLFGAGPDQGNVEKILATEGRGLPVRLAGKVDSETIHERLLECDVIVLLSDYEGLPIALMEAMACGCVPICLRIRSGIPELVEDGVTGLLVDDRGDSFVKAVRRLHTEPGLWERLSRAARAKIESSFSSEICAKQWAELLQRLHKNAGKKRAIKIPKHFDLPPLHPHLNSEDVRQPAPPLLRQRLHRKARTVASRIKRRLIGSAAK